MMNSGVYLINARGWECSAIITTTRNIYRTIIFEMINPSVPDRFSISDSHGLVSSIPSSSTEIVVKNVSSK